MAMCTCNRQSQCSEPHLEETGYRGSCPEASINSLLPSLGPSFAVEHVQQGFEHSTHTWTLAAIGFDLPAPYHGVTVLSILFQDLHKLLRSDGLRTRDKQELYNVGCI